MNHWWIKYLPSQLRPMFEGRETLQKVTGNTAWLFGDQVARMFVGFFVLILITRYLGPEQFGVLSYCLAIVAMATPFYKMGIDGILLRESTVLSEQSDRVIGTAIFLRCAAAFIVVPAVYFLVVYLRPGESIIHGLTLIIALGILFRVFDVIEIWFHSQIVSRYGVVAKASAYFISAIFKIICVYMGYSLWAISSTFFIEAFLGSIFILVAYKAYGKHITKWRLDISICRNLLKEGSLLIFSGVFVHIYLEIDKLMIAYYLDDFSVGIYSASVYLSSVWYFIPIIILQSVYSTLVKDREADISTYNLRVDQLFSFLALSSYAIIVPVALFSENIIYLAYGKSFEGAASILSIHILSLVFVFLGVARNNVCTMERNSKFIFFASLSGALVNVTLNLFFIPLYGTIGAAYATFLSYFITNVAVNFFYYRTRHIFICQLRSFLGLGFFSTKNAL